MSTLSKGFSSETNGKLLFRFYMQPSSKGGKKVNISGTSNVTKAAAMPIDNKNL